MEPAERSAIVRSCVLVIPLATLRGRASPVCVDSAEDLRTLWHAHHREWSSEAGLPPGLHYLLAAGVDLGEDCLVFRVTDQVVSPALTTTCSPSAQWFCA